MSLLLSEVLDSTSNRAYHIHVPDSPTQATVPAIIVFHAGGQDAATIARRWGVDPPNPVPSDLENYLLVLPLSDPGLGEE